MLCGLGEEECTKFRKQKMKKEKKLYATKSEVGMKGYLMSYNYVKYFLPYLSRF